MPDHRATPVTRRELRLAERRAAAGPLSLLRAGRRSSGRHAQTGSRSLLAAPVAQLGICALLVTGGVLHVQVLRTDQVERQYAATVAEAAQVEAARHERVSRAASVRLNGQASAYAAATLDQALAVARAAVEHADAVVQTAAPVVSAESLTPLDVAVADLAAIIAGSPAPADVSALGATAIPSSDPVTIPVPTPAPSPVADQHLDPPVTSPTTVPEAVAPSTAPQPTAPLQTGADPRSRATGADLDGSRRAVRSLGLDVSADLLAAAERVTTLSAVVKAEADAQIAAAQAAAEAAAAAEAHARELAERIAAADAAPNGAIPTEVLCAVDFDPDLLLRCDAATALESLNVAYRDRFRTDLSVDSSYRDLQGQVSARHQRGSLAATPGTSNHGRGVAVDLGGIGSLGQFDSPGYLWLKAHSTEHGWHHPAYMEPGGSGPFEPWHWEFGTDR